MKILKILINPLTYYIYPTIVYILSTRDNEQIDKKQYFFKISKVIIILFALRQFVFFSRKATVAQIITASILARLLSSTNFAVLQDSSSLVSKRYSSGRYNRIQLLYKIEKLVFSLLFLVGTCILKFTFMQFGSIGEEHLMLMATQFEGKQNIGEKIDIILMLLYKNIIPSFSIFIYIAYYVYNGTVVRITLFPENSKLSFSFDFTSTKLTFLLLLSFLSFGYMIYEPSEYTDSNFYKENYVFSDNIITFPKKKRNMLIIMLESVENTFGSKQNGGAFDESLIPHLENISLDPKNIHFTDIEGKLGGINVLRPTTYSLGATFAMLCGAPTGKPPNPSVSYRELMFYPQMKCLGDITKKNGYVNMATFGTHFGDLNHGYVYTAHGFDRKDVYSKSETDPFAWKWVHDYVQIQNVKKHLTKLGQSGSPFFYVYTTMDTHSPGLRCKYCNVTSNAIKDTNRCNDRQIYEFLEWLKQQSYYNETTILIVGDHLIMNDYVNGHCDNLGYVRRKPILTIINSVVQPKTRIRPKALMFDVYPTLLAASGVQINGNKLALGANLFSEEKTIYELFDGMYLNEEMRKQSKWYIEKVCGTKVDDSELNLEGNLTISQN